MLHFSRHTFHLTSFVSVNSYFRGNSLQHKQWDWQSLATYYALVFYLLYFWSHHLAIFGIKPLFLSWNPKLCEMKISSSLDSWTHQVILKFIIKDKMTMFARKEYLLLTKKLKIAQRKIPWYKYSFVFYFLSLEFEKGYTWVTWMRFACRQSKREGTNLLAVLALTVSQFHQFFFLFSKFLCILF